MQQSGKISHHYSEHGSVIKFVNELYGLVPLASLPDEKRGRELGKKTLGQPNLGPSDDPDNNVGDLTEAFDLEILRGHKRPVPLRRRSSLRQWLVAAPLCVVTTIFAERLHQWRMPEIGILPTDFKSWADYKAGKPIDPYPVDVNPRPTQSPGTPPSNWNA